MVGRACKAKGVESGRAAAATLGFAFDSSLARCGRCA